jgi:biotin carboxyl carrier protein
MEGRTLAIAAFNTKLDDDFNIATSDPVEREKIRLAMEETAARIEADMDPVAAAARMDTDEVVGLSELRDYLERLVEAAWQTPRHCRNPRIWSLHDLSVLASGGRAAAAVEKAQSVERKNELREGCVAVTVATEGTFWRRASPKDAAFVEVGATVGEGDTIGLMEVMKTFAVVKAGVSGVIEAFAVEDGGSVEARAVVAWVRVG